MLINNTVLEETLKHFWDLLTEGLANNYQKKLTAGGNIKIENNTISCDVSTMNFKGSVATYADLPASADVGDAYNTTEDNTNYCWNGSKWFVFGNSVSYSNLLKQTLELVYPVGSYYWTSQNIDPNTAFGGEWERIKDRFVYAKGDSREIGETGGEETHTLTVAEMPKHSHNTTGYTGTAIVGCTSYSGNSGAQFPAGSGAGGYMTTGMSSTGGDQPHNNMPPYVVAYCWHRIA